MNKKNLLQSEIQTLRAFSVFIVFLYHTNIEFFSNGYLGVDIFFLISGYVITKRIFDSFSSSNKVDLGKFYVKRIKRIIPNLFFIICTTYITFQIFGPPNLSLFNETIYSLLGLSNLYYINHSRDYFNNIFEDPLGHTWSLGVEEQFYLIFPIIIYVCFKFKNNKLNILIAILAIISILSLLFFCINYNSNSLFSFYFSPFRFWEFLIGSFFFIFQKNIRFNKFIFILCIFFVLYITLIKENYFFDYTKNIAVLIFVGYIISSYKKNIIFENNFIIYIGNISYSFYLWHLPVLFFSDLYFHGNIYIISFYALLITIFLSSITYVFVEQKFRYIEWNNKLFGITSIFIFLLVLVGVYIKYFNENIRSDLRKTITEINYIERNYNWYERSEFENKLKIQNYKVYNHCLEDSTVYTLNDIDLKNECLQSRDSTEIFFLFGDSHSVQFLPLLTFSEDIKNIYYSHFRGYGFPSNKVLESLMKKYETIYLLTNIGDSEELDYIRSRFEKIKEDRIKLIIFNSTPSPSLKHPFKCLIHQKDCFINKTENIKERNLSQLFIDITNFRLLNSSKVFLFDTFNLLCGIDDMCKVYDKKSDTLIYRDDSHIVLEGAITILEDFKNFLDRNKLIKK